MGKGAFRVRVLLKYHIISLYTHFIHLNTIYHVHPFIHTNIHLNTPQNALYTPYIYALNTPRYMGRFEDINFKSAISLSIHQLEDAAGWKLIKRAGQSVRQYVAMLQQHCKPLQNERSCVESCRSYVKIYEKARYSDFPISLDEYVSTILTRLFGLVINTIIAVLRPS